MAGATFLNSEGTTMKVLVIGNGGREHALCWKLAQSRLVSKLYCAPGNAGTDGVAENVGIAADDLPKLLKFALDKGIGLTVPGPEAPLCAGIVDLFRGRGLKVFGPGKEAARLEGSKCFSKDFMRRHGVPTAASAEFTDRALALDYVRANISPEGIVIKADGLAAGKGVIVATDLPQALAAVESCFDGAFGEAGSRVLIEETLVGEEASILAFLDGNTIQSLISSQDHKRVGEGDSGPNTGGMGAYCPAPVVDAAMMEAINKQVLYPTLAGMAKDKLYYRGVIYAGVMVTAAGPKVLEYNVRFGDPETQAVLCQMKSDLAEAMLMTIDGQLSEHRIKWYPGSSVCVVMAAKGYPGSYAKGAPISGLEEAAATGAQVFHAGTALKDGFAVTSGGRVLGVTARGADIVQATARAYAGVDKISWDGVFCRRDIAHRAIARGK